MHQIDEILRKLNTVAAKIQPELATHLQQIQQRLDRAHQAAEHRPFHANATQPVLAQVSLAASGQSGANQSFEYSASTSSPTMIAQTVLAAPPLIVQAPSDNDVSVALWIDPQYDQSDSVPENPADEQARRASAAYNLSAASTLVQDAITQPHEPTAPHFVLRQNQSSAPKTIPDQSLEVDSESAVEVLEELLAEALAEPASEPVAPPPVDLVPAKLVPAKLAEPELVQWSSSIAEPAIAEPALAEPEAAVGLPLFESLWFRQAAPNAYTAKLVDRILQKVPSTAPAVLHFCQDIQSQASSSLVCTQIAWEMSRRGLGEVLLIDADFGHRDISRQLGHVYLSGLSEVINLGQPLEALIRPTGVENLSWLSSGSGDISFRRIAGGRWAEISLQLRRRFQWVCVHAGAAQDRVTATWGRFCDYSYLITNMDDDLGPATKQVVDLLRTSECRVSGLITID